MYYVIAICVNVNYFLLLTICNTVSNNTVPTRTTCRAYYSTHTPPIRLYYYLYCAETYL
jgi:hypothetical protein